MVAIAGLLILDRLLVWMGSRGWIYWRKDKPRGGGGSGMSGGLTMFQSLVEPEVRHVIIDRDQRRTADTSEQGAPPGSPGEGPGARDQTKLNSL